MGALVCTVGQLAGWQMFTAPEIDGFCEMVLVGVTGDRPDPDGTVRALVTKMAADRPEAPALSPVLPLAMAAAAIETMLAGPEARAAAAAVWRAAALIAAEVLALQAEAPDHPPRLARLAARWPAVLA